MNRRPLILVGLAALLLAAAVAVDLAWFRPQKNEMGRLLAERSLLEGEAAAARGAQNEVVELLRYVQDKEEPGVDWLEQYRNQDALGLLERLRTAAGLDRTDLILREKEPQGPFTRTRYFLALQGPYARQIRFLQALEQSLPLVVVDSFVLENIPGSSSLLLKLNASVFSLTVEGA